MPAARSALAGKDRLILALDVPTAAEALAWTRRLAAEAGLVKVGLELFVAAGPPLVLQLASESGGVFLDLKLHDIPHTVAGAVRSAGSLGVRMLTLHAAGGPAMLAAAVAAARAAKRPPLLLGVTVLTSLDAAALEALALPGPVPERVVAWARLCQSAGLAGVVCAAAEAAAVRAACGPDFAIVTPGIRAPGAARQDQARAATAAEARRAGADFLVVGRAVTDDPDPLAALRRLAREVA